MAHSATLLPSCVLACVVARTPRCLLCSAVCGCPLSIAALHVYLHRRSQAPAISEKCSHAAGCRPKSWAPKMLQLRVAVTSSPYTLFRLCTFVVLAHVVVPADLPLGYPLVFDINMAASEGERIIEYLRRGNFLSRIATIRVRVGRGTADLHGKGVIVPLTWPKTMRTRRCRPGRMLDVGMPVQAPELHNQIDAC